MNDEPVVASLSASSKDIGSYSYAATGGYTVELSSTNYVVGTAQTLTIAPLPVVLS